VVGDRRDWAERRNQIVGRWVLMNPALLATLIRLEFLFFSAPLIYPENGDISVHSQPTISSAKPFKKLQAEKGMGSKSKVGSWLDRSEAYDSGSDSESSASGSVKVEKVNGRAQVIGIQNGEGGVEVDWEAVLPRIRPGITDKSKKRRGEFVARYLTVTPDCELSDPWCRFSSKSL
jgi:hypothetical protein